MRFTLRTVIEAFGLAALLLGIYAITYIVGTVMAS